MHDRSIRLQVVIEFFTVRAHFQCAGVLIVACVLAGCGPPPGPAPTPPGVPVFSRGPTRVPAGASAAASGMQPAGAGVTSVHASEATAVPGAPTAASAPTAIPIPFPADAVASPPSHIFLIVLSHTEYPDIIGSPDAPYLNTLAAQYAIADQYYAIRHPGLGGDLALISGHSFVTTVCMDCFVSEPNLVDLLEAKGKTWRSYQEDLPAPCAFDPQAGGYSIVHDPFLYFQDIRTNDTRCHQVVPLAQLDTDMQYGSVPDFAWISPNASHNPPGGSQAAADRWLADLVPQILSSDVWKQNGLLFITWDEGTTDDSCCNNVAFGGHVPLLVVAPQGKGGYHLTAPSDHYTLLRTIEDLWHLDRLGHSADAETRTLWDIP